MNLSTRLFYDGVKNVLKLTRLACGGDEDEVANYVLLILLIMKLNKMSLSAAHLIVVDTHLLANIIRMKNIQIDANDEEDLTKLAN